MTTRINRSACAIAALPLILLACTSDGLVDEQDDDDAIKSDSSEPRRFTNLAAFHAGDLRELTLNPDMTFGSRVFTQCLTSRIDCSLSRGSYRFTKSSKGRFIQFRSEDGEVLERYKYAFVHDELRMTRQPDGRSFKVTRVDGTKFVADVKAAVLEAAPTIRTASESLPPAAQHEVTALTPASPELTRMEVDGITAYIVGVMDARLVEVFDETGRIAVGHTDITGQLAFE